MIVSFIGGGDSGDNNNVTYIPLTIMSCRDHKVEKNEQKHDQPVFSAEKFPSCFFEYPTWPFGNLNVV